ncbi:MAG: archaeosortase/exosortase family protein, partial [Puniceicoccales bacterium]
MTPRAASFATAVVLALLLGMIWTRPVVTALPFADSWPLLIGLPFIYYLGRPWRRVAFLRPASLLLPIFGVLLIAGGIISQLVIAMALGWTLLLAAWVRTFFTTESSVPRLMLLALFAFPWIATDFSGLGWQFRLSAAQATDAVFSLLGFSIEREGTLINIQGVPISVEAACAGMNL